MAVYLREFATQAAYEAAQSSLMLPNVSLIDETRGVKYNPLGPEPKLIAVYNVADTSKPTQIVGVYGGTSYTSGFSEIEIDDVVQPSVVSTYTFSTTGAHTVKYTLTSPTSIGEYAFANCTSLTSIEIPSGVTSIGGRAFRYCTSITSIDIPNSVTNIGDGTFYNCSGLTSIIIPSGVTSIGDAAFQSCSSLTSIMSNATTAPTITYLTFNLVHNNGTLTVPSGSSGYDVWMGTRTYYLGYYNWTKVEQ